MISCSDFTGASAPARYRFRAGLNSYRWTLISVLILPLSRSGVSSSMTVAPNFFRSSIAVFAPVVTSALTGGIAEEAA